VKKNAKKMLPQALINLVYCTVSLCPRNACRTYSLWQRKNMVVTAVAERYAGWLTSVVSSAPPASNYILATQNIKI